MAQVEERGRPDEPVLQPSAVKTIQMQSLSVKMGLSQQSKGQYIPGYQPPEMPNSEQLQELQRMYQQRLVRTCLGFSVDGAARGAILGLAWGIFQGTYYGWQDKLRGTLLAKNLGVNAAANTVGFAGFVGLYQLSHCAFENTRNVSDWKNASLAGMVSGGTMGIPLALRVGQPQMVLFIAAFSSGLCGGLQYAKDGH